VDAFGANDSVLHLQQYSRAHEYNLSEFSMKSSYYLVLMILLFSSCITSVPNNHNATENSTPILSSDELDYQKIRNRATQMDPSELTKAIVNLQADPEYKTSTEKKEKFEIYLNELMVRANHDDFVACFWLGWYQYSMGESFRKNGTDKSQITPIYRDALKNLGKAANNKEQRAISIIGDMYLYGLGTEQSSFIAATWYLKASYRYYEIGDQNSALLQLEKSLRALPDYNAALEWKKIIMK